MKAKLLRILPIAVILAILIAVVIPFGPGMVYAAPSDRYWVGGTGNWSQIAHWDYHSGGVGGDPIPDTETNVYFDAASFTGGGQTITAHGDYTCHDMIWTGVTNTPSFAGGSGHTMTITGSLTLDSGMIVSVADAPTFVFTSTGVETITIAGRLSVVTSGSITFNGTNGQWTLQDDLDYNEQNITLTKGSLITNNKNITCETFQSETTNTRSITLGSSIITCEDGTGTNGGWKVDGLTGLTFDSGTSTINAEMSWDGASALFGGTGSLTYYDVNLEMYDCLGVAYSHKIEGVNTFHNLDIEWDVITHPEYNGILKLSDNLTITGTLTINGYSQATRILMRSDTILTPRTLTAAAIVASNVDFLDITGAGAASWDLSAITGGAGNLGGNSGITFTAPGNHYWVNNSDNWSSAGAWSSSSGGAGGYGIPLPQDTAIFNDKSFTVATRTVTIDVPYIGNVNSVDVINNPNIYSATTINVYGELVLGTHSWTAINGTYFYTRDQPFFNTGSTTLTGDLYIFANGTTCTLSNNLIITGTLYHRAGTFDALTFDITAGYFDSSTTTYTRVLSLGTGTHTFNGTAAASKWNFSATNNTLQANTATIVLTNATANAQTFTGGSGITTYNILRIQGDGNYQLTFNSANTYNKVIIDRSVASKTIAGNYTLTVTGGFFVPLAGVRVVTITNTDFTKASGLVVCDYLTISGSAAGGGATFYAGAHSTDSGGNSGWIFGSIAAPAITTVSATLITGVAATLNATVTSIGGYPAIDVGFEYGKTNAYGTYTAFQIGIAGIGAVTGRRITALESSTLYHYRAIVRFNEADYIYGADATFTTAASSSSSGTTGVPLVTTVPPDIPNMYVEGETGGLFGLEDFVNPALATAGIPEALFWYTIAFVVAIVLGFIAFGYTRQLIVQAVVSGVVMALFCGGGVLGDGLIPYWTVFIFIIEAVMMVVIQEKVSV